MYFYMQFKLPKCIVPWDFYFYIFLSSSKASTGLLIRALNYFLIKIKISGNILAYRLFSEYVETIFFVKLWHFPIFEYSFRWTSEPSDWITTLQKTLGVQKRYVVVIFDQILCWPPEICTVQIHKHGETACRSEENENVWLYLSGPPPPLHSYFVCEDWAPRREIV
jgi:hypothetical protein